MYSSDLPKELSVHKPKCSSKFFSPCILSNIHSVWVPHNIVFPHPLLSHRLHILIFSKHLYLPSEILNIHSSYCSNDIIDLLTVYLNLYEMENHVNVFIADKCTLIINSKSKYYKNAG